MSQCSAVAKACQSIPNKHPCSKMTTQTLEWCQADQPDFIPAWSAWSAWSILLRGTAQQRSVWSTLIDETSLYNQGWDTAKKLYTFRHMSASYLWILFKTQRVNLYTKFHEYATMTVSTHTDFHKVWVYQKQTQATWLDMEIPTTRATFHETIGH